MDIIGKNEKYEVVLEDEILEGFEILNQIDIDKRIIFGNHDIIKVKKPPQNLDFPTNALENCSILETEKKTENQKNKIIYL